MDTAVALKLKAVGPRFDRAQQFNSGDVARIWPKTGHQRDESNWLEAVARFGAGGRDLSICSDNYTLDEQGEYARSGVHAALLFLKFMANQRMIASQDHYNDYAEREGAYPAPIISMGAVRWVAEQVPSLSIEHYASVEFIARMMTEGCSESWKTRDQAGLFHTEGNKSVLKAWNVKNECEPLLRAILDARRAAHGADDRRTIAAQIALGEVLAAAASVQPCEDHPTTHVKTVGWGDVPHGDADAVLADALAAVRRAELPLTSALAVRTFSARAGWLSQRGIFADASSLLREVLEAFVVRDQGYTGESWGDDNGLAYQIKAVVRHTRKQPPESEALLEGCRLLRAHVTALRNYNGDGEHDLRALYFQDDAKLLVSHLRRVAGGGLLDEAETLARELLANRTHAWELEQLAQLLKVLAAQAALGWDGKAAALQACRAELCSSLLDKINSRLHPYGADYLFGSYDPMSGRVGYYPDGSGNDLDRAVRSLFGFKPKFLREYGLIAEVGCTARHSSMCIDLSTQGVFTHSVLAALVTCRCCRCCVR